MQDGEHTDRLRKLEERIDALKEAQKPGPKTEEHYSQAQQGWRMVTELVAGLMIGFGIGYGLAAIFGTLPIFTVLFIFAGFAAGVKTMLRTAQEFQGAQAPETQPERSGDGTQPDGSPDGKDKRG